MNVQDVERNLVNMLFFLDTDTFIVDNVMDVHNGNSDIKTSVLLQIRVFTWKKRIS